MNVAEWLHRTGKLHAENPALMSGTTLLLDYASFAGSAAALGHALRNSHGIAAGDRIAVFAKNLPEYLVTLYGIWYAGAVAVPINAKLHPREAAWIMENSGSRITFVSGSHGEDLAGVLPPCVETVIDLHSPAFEALCNGARLSTPEPRNRDDMAWLFYTSGTTGRPKGVMITHGNIHAMTFSYFVDVDEVFEGDAAFYAAPMSHGAGLYNFMHVLKAARHVVPESGGFEPAEIFGAAREIGNLHMFAAPTMVKRLVEHARRSGDTGEGIRTIVYGGGPMYLADIVEAVEELGPRFVQIYGQGESPMTITALSRAQVNDRNHPRWRERLSSVGTAQSCVEVAVLDERGNPVEPGQSGEIAVRGAPVMKGYWNNPDATANAIRDGWLWTGDVGSLDEDGFLTMKDRSKDVIISGGTNIYPREVEEALLTHPAVSEVSVIGRPDAEWGETVCAFVVLNEGMGTDEAALDTHCLENIARFKRPKTYRFVVSLPMNNYGKVLKTELRRMLD